MYVLMITPNNFPNGDAGAIRDESFGKIYQNLGYKVIHIGMNNKTYHSEYENIEFYSIYNKNDTIVNKILNSLTYKKRVKDVYYDIKKKYGSPKLIHIYDISESGIVWAKKLAKELKIPIIHDSVEWYSPCEFKYGKFSYPYILKDRLNRKIIKSPISVIAISRYLEKYFKDNGIKTIRIPVIMDSTKYIPDVTVKNNKIEIVYAGSPAKKDYLKECIEGFYMLPVKNRLKFNFSIYGVDEEFVRLKCNREILDNIKVYGRVSRQQVIEKLSTSDFAMLLRPSEERYTKAGFPTKSVEAMMNGCAMVCNLTSDLELYLKNMENAIIVKDSTAEEMCKALLYISKLSREEINKIKENARKTAEENFDFRIYLDLVEKLIEESKNCLKK